MCVNEFVFVKTMKKCRIIFISPSRPPEWRGVGGDPPAPVSAVWSETDERLAEEKQQAQSVVRSL